MKVPINPDILKWAREEINMPIEEVARRMKKEIEVIEQWELGIDSPTYAQLESMAYDIYKIPLAVFFFPEHPDLGHTQQSFRTLPDIMYNSIPSHIIKLFRKAEVLKENLAELSNYKNEKYLQAKNNLFNNNYNMEKMVEELRNFLGISIEEQKNWQDSKIALNRWKESIENIGIYIFKDAFRDDSFSGFCLYDEEFPIIYINNSMAANRQIFTMFHEIWHIYSKTSGIDNSIDSEDYLGAFSNENKKIEILCNKFSSEFLLPKNDFDIECNGLVIDEENINKLANLYSVSREVILRRYYDKKQINDNEYQYFSQKWINELHKLKQSNKDKPGGNYYSNVITYLGDTYLGKAYEKYYKNQINDFQLADYLNVKTNSLPQLETMLIGRWKE